jgi:uncharacterized protein HemX
MPDWLIPLLSLLAAAAGGYAGVHGRVSRAESRLERLEQEIGTHETGLRGAVHRTANRVTEIDMRLGALERRKDGEG